MPKKLDYSFSGLEVLDMHPLNRVLQNQAVQLC